MTRSFAMTGKNTGNVPAGERIFSFLHDGKFFGFLLIGIAATALDLGLLWFLTDRLGFWYLASAAVSYSCGIAASFLLNKFLNFRDPRKNYVSQFSLFAMISAGSLALSIGTLYVAVEVFSLHYLAGKLMAVGIAFFWNYFGQSTITFRPPL